MEHWQKQSLDYKHKEGKQKLFDLDANQKLWVVSQVQTKQGNFICNRSHLSISKDNKTPPWHHHCHGGLFPLIESSIPHMFLPLWAPTGLCDSDKH